jgi:hypothetical protein
MAGGYSRVKRESFIVMGECCHDSLTDFVDLLVSEQKRQ